MKLRFFDLCKKIAICSDHPQHKLGAALISGNKVIAIGFNKNKTNPNSNHMYKTHHAELDVILKAGRQNLSDCSLYIYRETKNGDIGNSFPCKYCQELLRRVKIKEIFYTTSEGYKSAFL